MTHTLRGCPRRRGVAQPPTLYQEIWQALEPELLEKEESGSGEEDEGRTYDGLLSEVLDSFISYVPGSGEWEDVGKVKEEMIRLYYQLLQGNETLPPYLQLDHGDIDLVRRTLLDFYGDQVRVHQLVAEVFDRVQKKMSQGRIGQAWLLLQLFDYDREVKAANERNLFIEEMTHRFLSKPDKGLEKDAILKILGDVGSIAELGGALQALWEEAKLFLPVLVEEPGEKKRWERLMTRFPLESGDEDMGEDTPLGLPTFNHIFAKRWRIPDGAEVEEQERLIIEGINGESMKQYFRSHLKSCYFLLLVNEETGWEKEVPRVFNWFSSLAKDGFTLLPLLHRMMVLDERTVNEALDGVILRRLPSRKWKGLIPSSQSWEELARSWLDSLEQIDWEQLEAGAYNLTGLLMDCAMGPKYMDPTLSWLTHKIL